MTRNSHVAFYFASSLSIEDTWQPHFIPICSKTVDPLSVLIDFKFIILKTKTKNNNQIPPFEKKMIKIKIKKNPTRQKVSSNFFKQSLSIKSKTLKVTY